MVDDVDGGQEPQPEVHMATAVQPPTPANSATSNKDESDARIKQIQVNELCVESVAYPGILFEGGVQQIQLRTEDRENRDLGAVAP